MKILCADRGRTFISIKYRDFYDKKGIVLKYATPYMYE